MPTTVQWVLDSEAGADTYGRLDTNGSGILQIEQVPQVGDIVEFGAHLTLVSINDHADNIELEVGGPRIRFVVMERVHWIGGNPASYHGITVHMAPANQETRDFLQSHHRRVGRERP
jgi:hypothetical protein